MSSPNRSAVTADPLETLGVGVFAVEPPDAERPTGGKQPRQRRALLGRQPAGSILDGLRAARYDLSYFRDGKPVELPANAEDAFPREDESNRMLSVRF